MDNNDGTPVAGDGNAPQPNLGSTPEPTPGSTPEPVPAPVTPEPMPVTPEPAPAPVTLEPVPAPEAPAAAQPIAGQPATGAQNAKSADTKKKKNFIIGCSIGGGVLLILIIVIIIIMIVQGGKKVVSCTTDMTSMGMSMSQTSEFEVGDGKLLGGKTDTTINLKELSSFFSDNEEDMVNSMIDSAKKSCEEHCTVTSDYVKGDYVRVQIQVDAEGVNEIFPSSELSGKSADEITKTLKEELEKQGSTTCVVK